jgi:HrpA-like RNA helicase
MTCLARKIEKKSSFELIDDEELEHIQSDIEENDNEGSIHSDLDDDEHLGEHITSEPLYVLPLYAILPSDKQARVNKIIVMMSVNDKHEYY